VGVRERKLGGAVHSIDVYITSNIEFCGSIRLRLLPDKWKVNIRIKKGLESEEDFVKLAEILQKRLDYKVLLEELYKLGFEEKIGQYAFLKKHS